MRIQAAIDITFVSKKQIIELTQDVSAFTIRLN